MCNKECKALNDEQESEHGKREDEATDGDGVVTLKTHKKKSVMERFSCKWACGCKT